jgi:hypothetical protein
MNDLEKPIPHVPCTSEYILGNFKPTDRIAVLVLNRQLGGLPRHKRPQALNSKHGCGTKTQMGPTSIWE